jgi:hypothetical protein
MLTNTKSEEGIRGSRSRQMRPSKINQILRYATRVTGITPCA